MAIISLLLFLSRRFGRKCFPTFWVGTKCPSLYGQFRMNRIREVFLLWGNWVRKNCQRTPNDCLSAKLSWMQVRFGPARWWRCCQQAWWPEFPPQKPWWERTNTHKLSCDLHKHTITHTHTHKRNKRKLLHSKSTWTRSTCEYVHISV